MLKVLKEDSAEHELALCAVEMFTFVMTPKDQSDEADVGVMFTGMFTAHSIQHNERKLWCTQHFNQPACVFTWERGAKQEGGSCDGTVHL